MENVGYIQGVLENIENQFNVKVLYACESGSKAWGFDSHKSDHDIKFVYARDVDWYLSPVRKNRLVIDHQKEGAWLNNGFFDFVGWDIMKVGGLIFNSNPQLTEWSQSPIIYKASEPFTTEFKSLMDNYFSTRKISEAYRGLAKGNYNKYLKSKEELSPKRYLYVIRALIAWRYVVERDRIPPIHVDHLFNWFMPRMSPEAVKELSTVLSRKRSGDLVKLQKPITVLNDFIDELLNSYDPNELAPEVEQDPKAINEFVARIIVND